MQCTSSLRSLPLKKIPVSWNSVFYNAGLITLGSIVFAAGLNSVLAPRQFLSGGPLGIAMMLHYCYPSIGIGLAYFLLNIPLFIIGWLSVSRRFMLYSIYGMAVFSLVAQLVRLPVVEIHDPILTVLLAGVVCGTGGGIVLRSLGSAGGLDILAVYLQKRFGLRMGPVIFASNGLVLLAGAFLFDVEKALYSIIFVYVSTRVIDTVLTSFNQRKSIMIVSDQAPVIARHILCRDNRGVTFLKGCGAYTGREKDVIFTITALTELPRIKEMVFGIDPNAFVVVHDTLEVLGRRHGKMKVY